MGLVHAEITLVNAVDQGMAKKGLIPEEDVKKMNVTALVDSGAYMLTIPDTIKNQLDLEVEGSLDVEIADGSRIKCEVVGPVKVLFKNRSTNTSAIVIPSANEVLLGVIPLEGMDVIIDPLKQELTLPPDRPYLARMIVK